VGTVRQSEGVRETRGRLRARAGRLMGRGGGGCAGAGKGRRPRLGLELAQQGGSFFSFLFSITHFIFVSFLFEQTYLVDNLGIEK
jgi:hypothetical protein